jgi:hypothetical protein
MRVAKVVTISPSSFSPDSQNAFSGDRRVPVEHVDQRIPVAAFDFLLVDAVELVEIVAQPQPQAGLARRLVGFQDEAAQQLRRAVLDDQRVGQTQIVLGNDVRIDRDHRAGSPCVRLLPEC